MKEYRFTTKIIKNPTVDSGYIEFPYDAEKEFGRKGQIKVKAYFDGFEYRGSLVRMGHPCHIIGLNKKVRDAIGKGPGDTVDVVIMEDTAERVVDVPADFSAALNKNKTAKEIFEKMSFTHRREYVEWIASSKKTETRKNRIGKSIEMLIKKLKQ
ncbi:MAG: antitermination protein NusB [Bacteroidetes bacterium GWF2_43_63]|nr:MAG: antitermination protein NusB [Bacteroidetes bacterium GWE2_42_42]OFY54864.1 MAG: antitermination protein NusB [Bacteroidetes bacterium GWF2_43_63]HCB63232.1 antitermination protein NusB [Bacteroidales bacterium]HCY21974.1 antitermination protein NusB [Bacteroidales bacterium]